MKKAFQMSLAGTLFTIEEDAYAKLGAYLESVRAHFAGAEGADEIVRDIEARAAEQLIESGKAIITVREADAVIASMGEVEDFGDGRGKAPGASPAADPKATERKKLYRDGDDLILGGVCSGLGHYFGVDALWVRIAFVVFALSTGFGILAYLILWAAVPEAKTASQKLEMSGTPVNLETISESVKERIEDAGEKASAFGKKQASKLYRVLSWPFDALRAVFAFLKARVLPILGRILQGLVAVASFAAVLGLSSFASLAAVHGPSQLFDVPLSDIMALPIFYAAVASAYLVLVLPLIFVFLLSTTLLRGRARVVGLGLGGIWFIAVMAAGSSGALVAERIDTYMDKHEVYSYEVHDVALSGPVTKVEVRDGMRVAIAQGPVQKLSVEGRNRILGNVKATVEGGTLTLSVADVDGFCLFCDFGSVQASLIVPNLESVAAASGARVEAFSWKSPKPVEVRVADGSRGDLSIDAPSVRAQAKGGARLTLAGKSQEATLSSYDGSRIEFTGTTASSTLSARSGSRIDAGEASIMSAKAVARDGSRITVDPDASIALKDEDDGSRIDVASTSTDPY